MPHSGKAKNLADHAPRCRRIVIKLGTNVIMRDDGRIALGRFYGIAESIAKLRHDGREVLLVSSGAIGLGMDRMGLKKRPTELAALQACAAIGQSRLMSIYDDAFEKLGCRIAQVLLTEDDFRDPQRFANLRGTLASLMSMGVNRLMRRGEARRARANDDSEFPADSKWKSIWTQSREATRACLGGAVIAWPRRLACHAETR